MKTETISFNADDNAQQLRNVYRTNNPKELRKHGIKYIKQSPSTERYAALDSGIKIKLSTKEYNIYRTLTSSQRRKNIKEFIFFKAQGTFQASKPAKNSPFQTARPFFSNDALGQQIFPYTSEDYLHKRLSKALNDRHIKTGALGDWRLTHSPRWKGFWSYKIERYAQVRVAREGRNYIIKTKIEESK